MSGTNTYKYIVTFSLFTALLGCNGNKHTVIDTNPINLQTGLWVSSLDSMYTLTVSENVIYEFYGDVPIDTLLYVLTHQSCDSAYYPSHKNDALFMLQVNQRSGEEYCYELTSHGEHSLAFIFTENGKVLSFRRRF